MTQPPAYNPAYSFTDFSSGSPTSQPPGVKLDDEFNAIEATLDATLTNLAKIQRDDGKLANKSVGIDQLDDSALTQLAAVGTASGDNIFGTKALADAAIGGIADGEFLQVLADETVGGAWTVYEKVSGAYVYRTANAAGGIASSAGAADAGKLVKLDVGGRLDRTLLAPDGYQKQKRIVLSDTGETGNLGDYSGTFLDSRLVIHGGPTPLDTQSCGVAAVVWGTHSKGATDYVGKSRGATIDSFLPCVTGDTIYRKFIQASGVGASFGHVGIEGWVVDATPTNSGEVAGRYYVSTDTGLHVSEASVARPTYYGLKQAFVLNRKQQAYFPGIISTPPAAGTDFGGWVHIGACGENAGEANLFFDLTSAVLMTAPVAGAYEVDANGRHYITDVNAKRDAVLVGQVKVGGDAGAVSAGAAAGTGPTISVVWGNGCARVTLTTGTTPSTGTLFTLTYPHTFATQSFAFLQAGNANTVGVVGKSLYAVAGTASVVVSAGIALIGSTQHVFDILFQGN